MLELRDIKKDYYLNGESVHALRGVSTAFRKNEFVAILGHSGCGKTTLLNIIGGLDQYTSGDLIINGISTKKYKDRDWDAYRNHSIGFVFQSYNLIPHQTVLSNVELALTISGISKSERRRRAIDALEKVGLGDQLTKKPNQMSGGQMQRVAIARALVNDPEILLADEPTGALDSETSVQVMEIIREIAKDRLVIMVTHNPELAEEYANRIIRIKDGLLVDDTNPYSPEEIVPEENHNKKEGRVSMSFFTALSLSLNNLMTKKGRTFMTAFAGSIGIIGIALILSLSNGINTYINKVQKDSLSSYPITIQKESDDTFAMMEAMMKQNNESSEEKHELDAVYSNTILYDMFNTMTTTEKKHNNLEKFKTFLDSNETIGKYASAIQYGYNLNMPIYTTDTKNNVMEANLSTMISKNMAGGDSAMITSEMSMFTQINLFGEMLTDKDGSISENITNKYEVIHGAWPTAYNEVVLVVSENNELSDLALYALGFKDTSTFKNIVIAAIDGKPIETDSKVKWTYDEICDKKYKIILPSEKYKESSDGKKYDDVSYTALDLQRLYESDEIGTELKIVGIIRPIKDAEGINITGSIAYTKALTEHLIGKINDSEIIKSQIADPATDVISGLPFKTEEIKALTATEKAGIFKEKIKEMSPAEATEVLRYISTSFTDDEKLAIFNEKVGKMEVIEIVEIIAELYATESTGVSKEDILKEMQGISKEQLIEYIASTPSLLDVMKEKFVGEKIADIEVKLDQVPEEQTKLILENSPWTDAQYEMMYDQFVCSKSTYEENLKLLGMADLASPDYINIYSDTFAEKDGISEIIAEYNSTAAEGDAIEYTDYVELLMSSITDIISGVSYLLIAFVGISLVVSSIMIGIITYISVLERTREIGILRAIGASKRDISNVFNAETMIVGFVSGLLGILVSVLLCIPINAIIHKLTDLVELNAALPLVAGLILIAISIILTLFAGIIPSRVAAKKDPVVALRSE